jgi:hypothetical protein
MLLIARALRCGCACFASPAGQARRAVSRCPIIGQSALGCDNMIYHIHSTIYHIFPIMGYGLSYPAGRNLPFIIAKMLSLSNK